MKKRIVALIGALTLTFAMSLNVFAADSVTADDVQNANTAAGDSIKVETNENGVIAVKNESVGEVMVFVKDTDLSAAATNVADAQVKEEGVTAVTVEKVSPKESLEATVAAVKVMADAKASIAAFSAPIQITPPKKGETITMAFSLASLPAISEPVAGEEIWAIDCDTNKYFVGTVKDGKVYFTSNEFSKYVIAKVKVAKQAANQPAYNPDWDPAVQQAKKDAAQAEHEAAWAAYLANGGLAPVVAVAPKTGDVVAMISIMAVIFLGGAATAVAMSKKRA